MPITSHISGGDYGFRYTIFLSLPRASSILFSLYSIIAKASKNKGSVSSRGREAAPITDIFYLA